MAPDNTARVKVLVVGCGIAGPVLAVFLKLKGYEPVVYERIKRDTDAGLSLMYVSPFIIGTGTSEYCFQASAQWSSSTRSHSRFHKEASGMLCQKEGYHIDRTW